MRLIRAVLLSLALHFLIGVCLNLVRPEPPPQSIDSYVEFIEDPPELHKDDDAKKEKAVVRSQQLPSDLLKEREEKEKARFNSETDQTVLEETRAAESGMTKNRAIDSRPEDQSRSGTTAQSPAKPKEKPTEMAKEPAPKETKPERKLDPRFDIDRRPLFPDDVVAQEDMSEEAARDPHNKESGEGRPLKFPTSPYGLERGRSTFGEAVPSDVKIGSFTALNTDRFLYYSFYARAEELIRHHWEKYVRAVLYSYQGTGAATGDEYWVTRVEILLDRNGNFVKGLIHQGSGLQGLDLAPIHAFREAHRIPHPPPEMVQDDGYIRMNYEFNVRMIGQIAGR